MVWDNRTNRRNHYRHERVSSEMQDIEPFGQRTPVGSRHGDANERVTMGTGAWKQTRNLHIPVDIQDDGDDFEGDRGREIKPPDVLDDEAQVETRGGPDKLHGSRKAVAKYGATFDCPGCSDLARHGRSQGKLIYSHSDACRALMGESMGDDLGCRRLMEKHGCTMAVDNAAGVIRDEIQEKIHQMQKALYEIEQRMIRQHHGAKHNQLDSTMESVLFEQMDVAEACGPSRIVEVAHKIMRDAAIRQFSKDKPRLFIGSPMCGPFGCMNNIKHAKTTEADKQIKMDYGRRHLEFCIKSYEVQWREGRYFLHEHPDSASAWHEECVRNMLRRHGVTRVAGDQCQYGFKFHEGQREGFARESVVFMTHACCIAKRLSRTCPNTREERPHNHVTFINGRAKAAQVYPVQLCRVVCRGFIEPIEADKDGQLLLAEVNTDKDSNT